jgi:hypothetical protein
MSKLEKEQIIDEFKEKQKVEQTNKYNNIRLDDFFPAVFRYAVLIIIYIILFMYYYNNSTQFILSIVMLILNFFTVIFLFKDFTSNSSLLRGILAESFSVDLGAERSIYTKIFIGAIIVTLLLNFATISINIYVYDYANKHTNNNTVYQMSQYTSSLMAKFIIWFKWYMIMLGSFAFLLIYSHSVGRMKIILQNLAGFILTAGVICISSYLCSLSVDFLYHKYSVYN